MLTTRIKVYISALLVLLISAICMSRPSAFTNLARAAYRSSIRSSGVPSAAPRNITPARVSAFGLPFGLFSTSSATKQADDMGEYPVKKTDSEWQAILSPEQVGLLASARWRSHAGLPDSAVFSTGWSWYGVADAGGSGSTFGLACLAMINPPSQKQSADQASSASSGARAPNDPDRTRMTTPSMRAPTVCIHSSFSQLHSITPSAA